MVKIFEANDQKKYLGVVFLLALLFYGIFIYRTHFVVKGETYFTLVDDAMISMRYARNLSSGFGLVWNIGKPPIEGFTNLGWTLYMALVHKFPIAESKISLAIMITSVFLLCGITYHSYKLCKIIDLQSEKAPLIASLITAFYYPLVFWSLRGMEVGIATFLVYLLVGLVISSKSIGKKKALLIGIIMLLAIFVRFDLVLQVTLVLVYLLYRLFKRELSITSVLLIFLFYLIAIVGINIFQYRYFGSMLPNTYYLKIAGVSVYERAMVGVQVFVEYATRDFLILLFIITAGIIAFPALREKRVFLLLALFFIQCAYSIYTGGDYAEPLKVPQVEAANRFITQGMPSLIILFSIIIDRFLHALEIKNRIQLSPVRMMLGISLATVVIMSGANWFKWTIYNAPLLDADIWRTRLGIHIRDYTDENAIIAVHAAGQIPYYSSRQTLDLLGKSDPVVARGLPATSFRPGHNKWNYDYSILELKPDLIADEWGQLSAFLANKPDYFRLNNGVWIRRNSPHINIDGLEQSYR